VDSDKASSVYADTIGSRVSQNDVTHVPRDVRSSVSACKEYKRERKKSRSRNFRGLFSSDCEDEITSVVSDNPQLYHRSCSMSTLGNSNNKSKKNLLMSKKTFDAVEKKMNHIQASLSSNSLAKGSSHSTLAQGQSQLSSETEDCTVIRLRRELEDKEKLAQKLQEQLSGLRAKPLDCGSGDAVDEWEDLLTRKRRQIKKKKEQLRRIQDDGNIDVKISLAEMEYSLEKDQIEMMNLSQKIQTARMENVKMSALKEISKQENLYRNVENSKTSLLYGHQLDKQHLENICVRYEGFGLEIREDSQDEKLQAGDRVIEINGEDVLRILPASWNSMLEVTQPPIKIVVLRSVEPVGNDNATSSDLKFDVAHVNGLKDDIAMIQTRLSEKLREGRHVSLELASVQMQRDKLAGDNTRLSHRIQYLEEQVAHLESGMKQVRDSLAQTLNTEIMDTIQKLDKIGRSETVFQKGGHVAHVHVPAANDEQYSSSTSGIYSVEGSEGSNSPEYNSWRSRVQPQQPPPSTSTATAHRWSSSIPDYSERGVPSHVARLVVGHTNTDTGAETDNDRDNEATSDKQTCGRKIERSNSRVTKVSNLIKWPKSKDKDKSSANLYVSDTSQV